MIEIQRATAADALLLSGLSKRTFIDAFGHTCPVEDMDNFVTTFLSEETISAQLKDPEDYYFIAYFDKTAVGYARLKEEYTDYPAIKKYKALELKRIYVLKEYQSKKIGAALIDFIENFALQKKFEAVWLGVWEFNDKALKFYKAHGYEDTGFTHSFLIGKTESTDHWMIKTLKQMEH